ncbi:imm11 family protein [Myxococcus sp. Y35]|uniref:imm11 family protein n=1 Tax=Pseudomyxococcus flavus TaxID=3115648 RepID=UPI003CEAAB09
MMRFRLLDTMGNANDRDLCFLTEFVEGIEGKSYATHLGERLSPFYPKDARIPMSPEHPGIKLSALIGNGRSMLIGSSAFKEAVQKHCANEIEYLPFTLHDHRGRPYSDDYCIINPIGTFDCLDLEASDISWSAKSPRKILRVREYVLDRAKMQSAPQLFRVEGAPSEYVIGRELARELYDRKLTNIRWTELRFSDEPKK